MKKDAENTTEQGNEANTMLPTVRWSDWRTELTKLKDCPQRQDSTVDQLRDLHKFACKLGFYDAADFIKKHC